MGVKSLGRVGYEAYGDKAEWKAYDGKPMPQWIDLPQHIRDKWDAAADAVCDVFARSVLA